jgi:hypothetical protein
VYPGGHRDATLVETLTATGDTKRWNLHLGNSFSDVPTTSGYYRFIELMLHRGVPGCLTNFYCPAQNTTREEMAVFLLKGKEGATYVPPSCGTPTMFIDVLATNPNCPYIEELARRGVTGGCGVGIYCPTANVTRAQMAVFLLLTKEGTGYLPPACPLPPAPPPFNDVPASDPYCRWIKQLVARGITAGCGNGNYCPAAFAPREQMAVFITATFGLSLYGS